VRQRSSSPPPTLGIRRQRSPESASLEPEGEDTLNKTSPHSKRITKRGRITSPQWDGPNSSPPSPAAHRLPNEGQTAEDDNSNLLTVGHMVTEETKHLESLLDSVLATLVIIQAASTLPIALSKHAREALTVLNKITNNDASTPALPGQLPAKNQPKKSYANATTPRPPTKKTAHKARSSPAGQQPPHMPVANDCPPRHSHSPNRLIVTWDGNPVPQSATSLNCFVDYLNQQLSPESNGPLPQKVAAANVTKSGKLIIHAMNDAIAADIQSRTELIHEASAEIPDFVPPSEPPAIEADIPWYGIVIHDLPGESLKHSFDATGEDYIISLLESEGGVASKDIRGNIRILCRTGEEAAKKRVSMLVRFEDQYICSRLRRNGIVLLGSWCRVSRYRGPKKKIATPPGPTS